MSSTRHASSLRVGVTGLTNETIDCYRRAACARHHPLMRILHDSQLALEFVDVSSIEKGYFQQNQTWSGDMALLASNQLDTLNYAFVLTALRETYFDLTLPFFRTHLAILAASQQRPIPDTQKLTAVFSTDVWLLLLLLIFIASALFLLYVTCLPLPHNVFNDKSHSYFRLAALFIPGPNANLSERLTVTRTGRTLVATVGCSVLFFGACYQSALLKYLLIDTHVKPFTDLSELVRNVANGHTQLVLTTPSNFFMDEVKTSNSGFFQDLRKATRFNPIVYEPDYEKLLMGVASGRYVWLDSIHNIQLAVRAKDKGVVEESSSTLAFYIQARFLLYEALHHNRRQLERLNRAIALNSVWLYDYYSHIYSIGEPCASQVANGVQAHNVHAPMRKRQVGFEALTLYDLSALFFILLLGLCLSACVLVAEYYFIKRRQKKGVCFSDNIVFDMTIQEPQTSWQLVNTTSGDIINVTTTDLVSFFTYLNMSSLNVESD